MKSHGLIEFLDKLRIAQMRLAALALLLMMMMPVADVFMRAVFNRPISGSYDFVETMLVIFVFHGMCWAFLTRHNIVIDIFDLFLPASAVRFLIRLSDVLTVVMLLIIGYAMLQIALQTYSYGDRKLELQIPIFLLWIIALAGLAGSILCAIGAVIRGPSNDDEGINV